MNSLKKIDFFAWERQYFDHLLPVWEKIPDDRKGIFYMACSVNEIYKNIIENKKMAVKSRQSIEEMVKEINLPNEKQNMLIMADNNAKYVGKIERCMVRLAHGCGQTFITNDPYYELMQKFSLILVPNEYAQNFFQNYFPEKSIEIVGCPKLDKWSRELKRSNGKPPHIVFSFHFDRDFVPETKTTWPYYKEKVFELSKSLDWKVSVHGHPKIYDQISLECQEEGINTIMHFEEVIETADLYVCDYSSTIYEFAYTGRPVVLLNAPWYRRDVEHGIRFWEFSNVGINCDEPADLKSCIEQALIDRMEIQVDREKAVKKVYSFIDGSASEKAATAILAYESRLDIPAEDVNTKYPGIKEIMYAQLFEKGIRDVVVYGAGEQTKRLIATKALGAFNVHAILDRDMAKVGRSLEAYKIIHPDIIKEYEGIDAVIISSLSFEEEMHENVKESGFDKIIYCIFKDNPLYKQDIFCELYL
ncbi:CDP-glycerol glycerophosphotransferase family protein [Anoxynatronum sibiricum]|uniref:CDP-glycerol glycerophosphotransferase family protein n=1 Tax=Anoxynatronum sibiricum TaxID=210623 RepID=A0ABU9VUE6_9CLOT